MKRMITVFAALICAAALCSCGGQSSVSKAESAAGSSAQTGNTDKFNISSKQLGETLEGTWACQGQAKDIFQIYEIKTDLSFELQKDQKAFSGEMTLNEANGMLTITYADNALPEKTYIWVDSYKNVSANTWYVDGGKFALGGDTFIRN